jgi:hypothetical protein
MPRVGYEHTTPTFERAKAVHAFDTRSGFCRLCGRRVGTTAPCVISLIPSDAIELRADSAAESLRVSSALDHAVTVIGISRPS